ncbi:MAG: ATP-binding cassette domain-containing protein [Campylobacteraceae bacterium]|jgi:putative ABC transport system ATP-binding protein|nr:ATP-binding cassette domain-containing protein [Campylobacteraceae bacterium]
MITLEDVKVSFKGLERPVLDIPFLQIGDGVKLAVTGISGSGKTTLINILCALERIESGSIMWDNVALHSLDQMQQDRFRGENVGLIMQDFYLYDGLSALQNVLLPSKLRYFKVPEIITKRAVYLLERLNISKHAQNVDMLSRGEKQRVAIARALVNTPKIIMADEPTASLDREISDEAVKLLVSLAYEFQATLICASHDRVLINKMDYCLELEKGRKVEASFL